MQYHLEIDVGAPLPCRTGVMIKMDDYEAAEAKCKCGWYGSADEMVQAPTNNSEETLFLCPKCDEEL